MLDPRKRERDTFFKVPGESRPFAQLQILKEMVPAMLETGAHNNVCGGDGIRRFKKLGFKTQKLNHKQPPAFSTADFYVPVHFDEMFAVIQIFCTPTLPLDIILGIPFKRSFNPCQFEKDGEEDEPEIESRRTLPDDQELVLQSVIRKFERLGEILLGRTNIISHDIDTGNNKPSLRGARATSPAKEKKIEQEFLRFQELGVIEPAQSAYRNAMTVVER